MFALAATVIVGAGSSIALSGLVSDGCPTGLHASSGTNFARECVGVTDGQYMFGSQFAAVEGRIAAENKRVTSGDAPVVTIALLSPFPTSDTDTLTPESMRHELEGAYAAQVQANRSTPKVKLVLANEGALAGLLDRSAVLAADTSANAYSVSLARDHVRLWPTPPRRNSA
ncbi:hypothetical protein [Actinocrispum wychmicini]|uniref:hypothetical protein n=1 Tax=Actinocrispum wychmicini TaxID=1213861 RepID=UPI001047C3A0|nr:hypothetical protein [Actinocrispum wychmicini]